MVIQILALMSAAAHAGPVIDNVSYTAGNLAEVRVLVKDVGEPVYEPLVLTINVLCKDNRLSKNSSVPHWLTIKDESICAWGGQNFKAAKGQIIFHAAKSAIVIGDAPCEPQKPKALDLNKICERWNN